MHCNGNGNNITMSHRSNEQRSYFRYNINRNHMVPSKYMKIIYYDKTEACIGVLFISNFMGTMKCLTM